MRSLILCLLLSTLCGGLMAQGPALHYRFNENGVGNAINEGNMGSSVGTRIGVTTDGEGADGTSCLEGVGTNSAAIFTGYTFNEAMGSGWTLGYAVDSSKGVYTGLSSFEYFCGDGTFHLRRNGSDHLLVGGPTSMVVPDAGGRYGWIHVVLRYAPPAPGQSTFGQLQVFVNGRLKMQKGILDAPMIGAVPLKVGGNSSSTASMWPGTLMDDFRFYKRPLSDAEITRWAQESAALPEVKKVNITELYLGEPDAVELTNFTDSQVNTTGWNLIWKYGVNETVSAPLNVFIAAGETLVIKEPGTLNGIAPGTSVFDRFTGLVSGASPTTVALRDGNGFIVDEVQISGTTGPDSAGSLGGAFRGLAFKNNGTVSMERVWKKDSNSARDWTSEVVHSLGLKNRSSGFKQTTSPSILPSIRINEIDVTPDYIELYNPTNSTVDLSKWYFICSADQGSAEVVISPFRWGGSIGANSYLVIGDTATQPVELPSGVTYVDLTAAYGGNIPFGLSEFSCALYDGFGQLIDVVRTKNANNLRTHTEPRAPSHPADFFGSAPHGSTGDRSIGRNVLGDDSNDASDWYTSSQRTMGSFNVNDGEQGRSENLDFQWSAQSTFGGMNLVLNAGSQHVAASWGLLLSVGHGTAQGPFLGLDLDAVDNYFVFSQVGLFQPLDNRGSTRLDYPASVIPQGLSFDGVAFVVSPNGQIAAHTEVISFDS